MYGILIEARSDLSTEASRSFRLYREKSNGGLGDLLLAIERGHEAHNTSVTMLDQGVTLSHLSVFYLELAKKTCWHENFDKAMDLGGKAHEQHLMRSKVFLLLISI
jgi:hypothetical protein